MTATRRRNGRQQYANKPGTVTECMGCGQTIELAPSPGDTVQHRKHSRDRFTPYRWQTADGGLKCEAGPNHWPTR